MTIADLRAEAQWLSCVTLDAATLTVAPIPLADFYSRQHALIAGAMMALKARGEPVDVAAVRVELSAAGNLARAGGDDALSTLFDHVPNVHTAPALAREVRRLARLRTMSTLMQQGAAAAAERDEEAVRAVVAEMVRNGSGDDDEASAFISFANLLASGLDGAIQRSKGVETGLRLGTPSIDRDYQPSPGHLVILGGRPNVGKTSLSFAWHIDTAQRGLASAIISIDDDSEDYGGRALGAISAVNPSRIFNDRLTSDVVQRMAEAARTKSGLPIHFNKIRSRQVSSVIGAMRYAVQALGCKWISIDFLTAIQNPAKGDRREKTNDTLAQIAMTADSLKVPVVLLVQLKRPGGENDYAEPHLGSFKETGEIEEHAKGAVLLWRKSDKPGEPVLAKNAKVKRAAAGHRFTLERDPDTGLLVEKAEDPWMSSAGYRASDDGGWA